MGEGNMSGRQRVGARFFVPAVAALLAALLLPGCAGDPQEALQGRAEDYWEARVAKDPARSYAFLEPAWRAEMTLADWTSSHGGVEWPRAVVYRAVVKGNRGTACVQYDYVLRAGALAGETGTVEIGEPWVRVEGVWYKEEVAPFTTPAPPPECGTPPPAPPGGTP
jgi:hypothetical protein